MNQRPPGYRFAPPCGARNFHAVTEDGLKFRPLRKKRGCCIRPPAAQPRFSQRAPLVGLIPRRAALHLSPRQNEKRRTRRLFPFWLRGKDSNQRPPGYEPDELPAALPRDIALFLRALLDYHKARGKSRTFFARRQFFSRDRNADDHQRRKCFAVKPGITGFPLAACCAGAFRRGERERGAAGAGEQREGFGWQSRGAGV